MRLPGMCTTCHRQRQVQVSGHGMAMLAAHGVPQGVCADCQEKDDARRWLRGIHGGRDVLGILADSQRPLTVEQITETKPTQRGRYRPPVNGIDPQRIPHLLRLLVQRRLAFTRRGTYTITPLGLDVIR